MAMTRIMQLHSAADGQPSTFSYKGPRRYLITLSTFHSREIFVEMPLVVQVLDVLRDSAWKCHFDILAYSFLPNTLRIIALGKSSESDMHEFLHDFRACSSAALESQLGHPLWKRRYLERVLRRNEEDVTVAREVFLAPVKLGLANKPEAYPFQGSFTSDVALICRPVPRPRRRLPFRRRS